MTRATARAAATSAAATLILTTVFILSASVDHGLKLSPRDGALLLLVSMPFMLGYAAGFSASRFLSLCIAISGVIYFELDALKRLKPLFPTTNDTSIRLVSTWTLWAVARIVLGFSCRRFLRAFGAAGFYLTYDSALIGVCLSSLLFDGLIPLIVGRTTTDTSSMLIVNSCFVVAALYQLLAINARAAGVALAGGLRQILMIFTVFGVLTFVVSQFAQEALYRLLWQIPRVPAPAAYQWFVSVIAAGFFAFSFRRIGQSGHIAMPDRQGLQALLSRSGVPATAALDPLDLVPFTYDIPSGWTEVERRLEPTYLAVEACPADGDEATLLLEVYQHYEPTVTEAERLRQSTFAKLLSMKAKIGADRMSTQHGMLAHECAFLFPGSCGYVVRYVRSANQYVVMLLTATDAARQQRLMQLEAFIASFRFSA